MLLTETVHKTCMPIADLLATKAFRDLSPLQKKFVRAYVLQGSVSGVYDALAATKSVLPLTAKHLDTRARNFLKCRKIKEALDIFFQRSPLEKTLCNLQEAARRSVQLGMGLTPETIQALNLFSEIVRDLEAQAA